MSNTSRDERQLSPPKGKAVRVVSGLVAVAALAVSFYLAKVSLGMATSATGQPFVRDHAPAVLGLPILLALATAIVCGARALEPWSEIELLGLRAEGAGAAVLGWILVFSALVVALRALW